jgi:acyl-CoA synthetase (NDP forming)
VTGPNSLAGGNAHPLSGMFRPSSIAIIGASKDATSLSGRPLDILLQHRYDGRVYPVNPNRSDVGGLPTWPSIKAVPEAVDLVVVAVRASLVLDVLRDCASAEARHAVIFTSGFAEEGAAGRRAEDELAALARASGMRILGPNAEGFFNVHDGIPVSFSPAVDYKQGLVRLQPGNVAVVSQSGGLGFALFNGGQRVGVGVSHVVTTGNEADLEALEVAGYLLEEASTKVVALLIEGFRRPEKLGPVARRAAELQKSLVVAKLGRSSAGSRGAWAHTAHDAGDDSAYQEEFARWGVVQAEDQEDLLDIAFALSRQSDRRSGVPGRRVGIITISGGAGVWLADACDTVSLSVPELRAETQERLRALIPSYGSPKNPVDVTAQVFGVAGIAPVLDVLCQSPEVDAVALVCSLASPRMLEREETEIAAVLARSAKPVVVYSYTSPGDANLDLLGRLGLPWYPNARRAARALAVLEATGQQRPQSLGA